MIGKRTEEKLCASIDGFGALHADRGTARGIFAAIDRKGFSVEQRDNDFAGQAGMKHAFRRDTHISNWVIRAHRKNHLSEGEGMREKLKAARRAKGLTQEKMAEELHIGLRHYKKIESGETLGSIPIWDKLEDMLGVNQRVLRENHPGKADSP